MPQDFPADHLQEKYSRNWKILMIFLVVMIGFFGYLLLVSCPRSSQKNYGKYFFRSHLETQKDILFSSLKKLLSEKEVQAFVLPPPGSLLTAAENYKWSSYTLSALDAQTGQKQRIAFVHADDLYIQPFKLSGNQLFYLNKSDEMKRLFLDSGKYESLNIPDVTDSAIPEKNIADFLVNDGKIVYLKGICQEDAECSLWTYDLSTSENLMIIGNLNKKVEANFLSGIRFKGAPSQNSVEIFHGWGDAGIAGVSLYAVDLKQKTLRKITSASINYGCEENADYSHCDEEQLLQNQKFITIVQKQPVVCHDATVTFNAGGEFETVDMVKGKDFEQDLEGEYVGCLQ